MLDELAGEYDGKLTIAKVNVDEQPATAEAFGIMSIPTRGAYPRIGRPRDGGQPRDPARKGPQCDACTSCKGPDTAGRADGRHPSGRGRRASLGFVTFPRHTHPYDSVAFLAPLARRSPRGTALCGDKPRILFEDGKPVGKLVGALPKAHIKNFIEGAA